MKPIRVIVLSADQGFLRLTAQYLASKSTVSVIAALPDGNEGLRAIRRERPDIVLLSMILRGLDGCAVLSALQRTVNPPIAIVCMELCNAHTIALARRYGAAYFLCLPTEMRCIYNVILEMSHSAELVTQGSASAEDNAAVSGAELRQRLADLGLSQRLDGCRFLAEALLLVAERPSRMDNITQSIYSPISARFHTSISSVERSIRTAIQAAYSQGALEALFENRPTNREFIAALYRRLLADRTFPLV